jgi:hypothetical protein
LKVLETVSRVWPLVAMPLIAAVAIVAIVLPIFLKRRQV